MSPEDRGRAQGPGDAAAPPTAVSVVVVNYEGEAYLPDCLDALRAQTFPIDEWIVVDNASQDGSRALLAQRYPDVRVLALDENGGPAPARNAGMRAARNRWVLLVDNDAVLDADVLAKLVPATAPHRGRPVAVVQTRNVLHDEPERVHYDGGEFHYAGLLALRNFYRPLDEAEGDGVVPVDGAVSVCLLVDRDVLLEAGGFDERFFILFEDLDLSLRLRLMDFAILSVEDARVRHKTGTPGISFRQAGRYPSSRVFFHSRNRWMFLAKNYRWRTLLVAAPGLLCYELVWAFFSVRSGGLGSWLRGKLAFFRTLPETLALRRPIQAARRLRDRDLLVGGPLTLAPHLLSKPGPARAAALLDGLLRFWWRCARRLAG